MLSALLVLLAIGCVASVVAWARHRAASADLSGVARFHRARELTTRWATDPGSIPEPARRPSADVEETAVH